jgi:lysophospholipase L1-like esterase
VRSGTALLVLAAAVACGGAGPADEAAATAPTTSTPATVAGAAGDDLHLVAIGDSIPYNSPQDCPGCTGFVDRYAAAIQQATGRHVVVSNLSQHTGLTLRDLLAELERFRGDLTAADAIVVGIAHNSIELAEDRPCGAVPPMQGVPDWSAMTEQCAQTSAEQARPLYDQLYASVADMRAGRPTVLRTINRYNDWIGYPEIPFTPEQDAITALFIGRWNAVLCETAVAHGFGCADVSTAFNGPDGLRPSGDLLAEDYTHPSDKGNEVIAATLADLGFSPLAG